MEAINYLFRFIFDTIVWILILRVWLQLVKADFYNPLSQFIVKVTNPMVVPVRRVVPGFAGLDMATILLVIIVSMAKFIVIPMINGGPFDPLGALYFGVLFAIKQVGFLLFILMLVMAIMSWVVQGYNPTQIILHQLTEPFLAPIRRIVPSIGGLDLSVLIAFLLLNVINILLSGAIPYWRVL